MNNELDIAVVGMAGRFPGARNLYEFWRNLAEGVESITQFSDEELLSGGVPAAYVDNPDYVKAAPILEDPGKFDADFFGFLPSEARTMDPQHRILLELAQEALEDAGYDPNRYPGRIGVFTGSAFNTYFMDCRLGSQFAQEYIPTLIASDKDFLSTRISYKLNLKGPSLTIQTACSTSMVAVHLARQSLLNEESDMALAGAISVRVPHRVGYFCGGGGVVSPDGHVRAFDASANGTVFGSGGGILVLKRLADALADGDNIHAVIKGSAINNDGSEKAGYTTPSVNGQADVVVEALANAAVEADSITYIEAHGSGTPVGDPVEIRALTKAFRNFTQRTAYCAIGSVKTNVGHLDAAAAVAGMIKTILALKHRTLPPSLHFRQPNPEIDFRSTPFYVNTQLRDWTSAGPRRAGVMSTGMGGTNAHVVLEEAPELQPASSIASSQLLVLSARTAAALDHTSRRLREFLERNDSVDLNDVAHTLRVGRRTFPHRRCFVSSSREDAIAALAEEKPRRVYSSVTNESEGSHRPVVFLFPGIADHYVGMGHGLYQEWPVFRQAVDRCAQILEPYLGTDIRKVLYPDGQAWKSQGNSKGIDLKKMLGRGAEAPPDPHTEQLNQTLFAHPALFAIEYALARLWQALGITPAAMIGHSMGEYVAACLAGVLSLEDALRLIATRARLVNDLPQGAMLAVNLPEKDVLPLLSGDLSISLINGPALCIVAGPATAVAEFEQRLQAKNIISRRVQNAHAFHSRMLSPIVSAFEMEVRKVRLNEPAIPYASNVTGRWITAREATNPSYWAMHTDHPARFSDALQELWRLKNPILLEAGPGRTLGVLAMQHPDRQNSTDPLAISSIRHSYENQSDVEFLLQGIGRLWLSGVEVNWESMYPGKKRRRVSLPTYPFERQNYWIDRTSSEVGPSSVAEYKGASSGPTTSEQKLTTPAASLDNWFYAPSWKRTHFPSDAFDAARFQPAFWVVIGDRYGGGSRMKAKLEAAGMRVAFVRFGKTSAQYPDGSFDVNPAGVESYLELIQELERRAAGLPINIIHLGSLVRIDEEAAQSAFYSTSQNFSFFSLLYIVQAIGELSTSSTFKIGVISNRLHSVTGEEDVAPAMATVLGPCGVIPKEYPNIKCFSIDLSDSKPIDGLPDEVLTNIISEFAEKEGPGSPIIAYRGQYRWERCLESVSLKEFLPHSEVGAAAAIGRLKPGGVYLITGGTGGIGLSIAGYLAGACRPKLVLTRRSPFPNKSSWNELLKAPGTPAPILKTITALTDLEKAGAEAEVLVADVANREQMQSVVAETLAKYGTINGVIHSAGVVKAGLIQAKTREAADHVMAPKVQGAMILFDLLLDVKPDFMVLFSSTGSILTPYAESDYSAANCFLDAFSSFATAHGGFHTLTINWPGWKEVGMLADLAIPAGLEAWKQAALDRAITPQDGVKAFGRALNSNLTQVIVSPENMGDLLKASEAAFGPAKELLHPQHGERAVRPAEAQSDEAVQPTDPVERTLVEIWRAVLGFERIGVHEQFFALGGHSFLAMQVVSRIRSRYPVPFTLKDFFECPTIEQASSLIQARMLEKVEGLSDDEVRRLLSED
ncbi:MAG: SDR family oxidoreductase [Terriglobales bacterium]